MTSFWEYKVYAGLVGVPLGGVVKWQWGCRLMAIFGDLCGYVFGIEMATYYPLSACNWLQDEWPWVALSCQNPFSASTSRFTAFDFESWIIWVRRADMKTECDMNYSVCAKVQPDDHPAIEWIETLVAHFASCGLKYTCWCLSFKVDTGYFAVHWKCRTGKWRTEKWWTKW